jgi:DNA-binding response OmpR family regulator
MAVIEMSLTERQAQPQEDDVYDDGYLRVEHKNYYVACAGEPIRLPRTEFLIISRLSRTPERMVTAQELWAYAWGNKKPLNSESLHVYIYRLRSKLTAYDIQIDTMVNVGYRLILRNNHGRPTATSPSSE